MYRDTTAVIVGLTIFGFLFFLHPRADAAFEELTISPRARAMGEVSVAVSADAWSFNHNPALLAMQQRGDVATSTMQPHQIGGFRLTALAISTKLPAGWGGIGGGYRYWGVSRDDIDLTKEQTLTLAHGFRLFEDPTSSAYVGWAVNAYNLEFGKTISGENPGSAWTVGVDLGAVVTLYERTRAGFQVRNLNSPNIGQDAEELQQLVVAGLAYEPFSGVITAFDIRHQARQELRFHGGAEFSITSALDLRMGLETDPNKLTAGFGVNLPAGFRVEYGFSTGGGSLDSSHQFGLGVGFGSWGGTP